MIMTIFFLSIFRVIADLRKCVVCAALGHVSICNKNTKREMKRRGWWNNPPVSSTEFNKTKRQLQQVFGTEREIC